jgi:hypothetical protein
LDLPSGDRKLAEHAFDLFQPGDERYNCAVLDGLRGLKPLHRQEFARRLSRMRQLSGCGGDPADAQHAQFVTQVKWFSGGPYLFLDDPESIRAVAALVAIPLDERQQVMELLGGLDSYAERQSFIEELLQLLVPFQHLPDRHQLIGILKKLPINRVLSVLRQTARFLGANGEHALGFERILTLLGEIPTDGERQTFADHLLQLGGDFEHQWARNNGIEPLQESPIEQRFHIAEQACRLVDPTLEWYTRANLVKVLASIPTAVHRQLFVDHFSQIHSPRDWAIKTLVIKNLLSFPQLSQSDFMTTLLMLWERMVPEEKLRIFDALSEISPENYEVFAARALLFTRWVSTGERGERTLQVLDRRLSDTIPPYGQDFATGENPYAQRVDVHAAGRDQKTREAFKLLVSLWQPSKEEIQENCQSLVAHVEQKDPAVAARVLTGTEKKDNDYGALLTGWGLSIDGQIIPAQTILAHLWHFVTVEVATVSPSDVEPAKVSLVSAMRESIEDDDDHVVCDPGKYQHLALSILQGRLEGVKFDSASDPFSAEHLVRIRPELLAGSVSSTSVPAPLGRRRYIRDLKAIGVHMQELVQKWQASPPRSTKQVFNDTFNYVQELVRADIFLDPRDVVFYLIFGSCETHSHRFEFDPTKGFVDGLAGMFGVEDYRQQYEGTERQTFTDAQRARESAALRAKQEREFAEMQARDRDKSSATAGGAAAAVETQQLSPQELREARLRKLDPKHATLGTV